MVLSSFIHSLPSCLFCRQTDLSTLREESAFPLQPCSHHPLNTKETSIQDPVRSVSKQKKK